MNARDAPPPHWHDEEVVRRTVRGVDPGRPLSDAERADAAHRMSDRGIGIDRIAETLTVSRSTAYLLLARPRR